MIFSKELSKEQNEILYLFFNEYLSIKEIAKRRQTTRQAVYKTIRKIKKKGLWKGGFTGGLQNRGVTKTKFKKKKIRLHNIQISILILGKSEKYLREIEDNNKLSISGATVILGKEYIQIYTAERDFISAEYYKAVNRAIEYLSMIYAKIENRFNILIDKDQYLNKKWARQHISIINDDIAKDCNEKQEQLIIKDQDDAKTRVITDNSFNLEEMEFIHTEKAPADVDKYKYFVESVINHREKVGIDNIIEMQRQQLKVNDSLTLNLAQLTAVVAKLSERLQ